MIAAFLRKARQVASDPVLRRWLRERAIGRCAPPPRFEANLPPYLQGRNLFAREAPNPSIRFMALPIAPPREPLSLDLAGEKIVVHAHDVDAPFRRSYLDTESLLALHRFAWLPLVQATVDPAWVQALWQAWCRTHSNPDDSWAWHPYTAAERAVNLLDYGARHGLPSPAQETIRHLAAHASAIAGRLEYYGEHNTSNHLYNNGRGLYHLGLSLGLPALADMGALILQQESTRIFLRSGVLREGSSHYHFLFAQRSVDVWLAARAHRRPEEPALREIAARTLAAARRLSLPGGIPLVGDISPDSPPEWLAGIPMNRLDDGWLSALSPNDRAAVVDLLGQEPFNEDEMAADGWMRLERGPWAALWHVAPDGWSPMPGHGHQDLGAAEIHFRDEPLIVDLGRGSYEDPSDAENYCSASLHATLSVDGMDPYPPNRPYYDPTFRRLAGGAGPRIQRGESFVTVAHDGFSRLDGVFTVERRWTFTDEEVRIDDTVAGTGRHAIRRHFPISLPVSNAGNGAHIIGRHAEFLLNGPTSAPSISPAIRWAAYGRGAPASIVSWQEMVDLPWRGTVRLIRC